MNPIYVTKSFLPPCEEYCKKIEKIWEVSQLTNQGPYVLELESKLKACLNVKNFHFLTNGTLALQLALSALGIEDGEIITTPFSYVATTSSILWQRCKPVFVDIEEDNFTIDVNKIESAITPNTKAIMAVHVFGYACDVEGIQRIADAHGLKVIYDGAHAFASEYKGKSLLDYGDVSTLSFHATKLFHTIEGGACVVKDKEVSEKLELQKKFGHVADDHFALGINAKANEFQAAMGLVNMPYLPKILEARRKITELYDTLFKNSIKRPRLQEDLQYNYAYYPVVFASEEALLQTFAALEKENIFPRRYFYPSLNTLPYVERASCPISETLSLRIACLPLYPDLSHDLVHKISDIILEGVQ